MILNFLAGTNINNFSLEEFYDYLNYLEFIGIDKNLLDSFNNIVGYGPNINIREYLDSLTSENIVRSKNNVYKKVKGKI
jgi:hypothetical protein